MTIARRPEMMSKFVDVTRTKAPETSHEPILLALDRQAWDDSVMHACLGWLSCSFRLEAAQTLMRRWRL